MLFQTVAFLLIAFFTCNCIYETSIGDDYVWVMVVETVGRFINVKMVKE